MHTSLGRFCFMILVPMITFSGYQGLGIFTGVFIILTAMLDGFVIFRYPQYESDLSD